MSTRPYQSAYPTTPQPGNPARTEAWALSQAARRLAEVRANPTDQAAMLDAIRLNWRLWTIFQVGVIDPTSALPNEIRNNMVNLCNFVDKHTVALLANPQPERLDVLISINRNLAAGLFEGSARERAAATSDAVAAVVAESA